MSMIFWATSSKEITSNYSPITPSSLYSPKESSGYDFEVSLDHNISLAWTIDKEASIINASLILEAGIDSWVGFGISGKEISGFYGMAWADYIIAINNYDIITGPVILDYYLPQSVEAIPCRDEYCNEYFGKNDVVFQSYTRRNGVTTAKFLRKLDTNDADDWPILPGPLYILYAHGFTDKFTFHSTFHGRGTLDFFTGKFVKHHKGEKP